MKERFTLFPVQTAVTDENGTATRGWLQVFASAGKILSGVWSTFMGTDSASSATPYAVRYVADLAAGSHTITLPAACMGIAIINTAGTVTAQNVDGDTLSLALAADARVFVTGVRS